MVVKRTTAALNDEELEDLASLFRLMSDRTRLNLLMLLAEGERNVTSLCNALKLAQPTVSHHLGLLRMSGLIANRRDGKQVFYSVNGKVEVNPAGGTIHLGSGSYRVRLSRHEGV